jgi:serine/threonine protein kinase
MRKEYELLSLCECPYVVRPIAVGLVEGDQGEGISEILLALERADSSLARDLAKRDKDDGEGGLDQSRTIQIGWQMLEALLVLSERRVVHCDIKPGNVLRFGDDVYKLCDFGTSRRIDLAKESVAVDLDAMSDGYMAPESWRESKVSPKTDVFALAATLWEVHTGSNPFAATFGLDIEERYHRVVMPQADRSPLLGVLAKMLHPDPARRLSVHDARADFMRLRALTLTDPLPPV